MALREPRLVALSGLQCEQFNQVALRSASRFSQGLVAMMKATALLSFVLAALIFGGPSFAAEKQVEFTPENGFGGESEGNGVLNLFLGKGRSFHVESRGIEQSDGSFRLEQTVTFQGQAPRDRVWIIAPVSPNHYSAKLSDAAGLVTGSTSGPRLS